MYKQVEKQKENKSRAVANSVAQKKSNVNQGFGFVDNRTEAIKQLNLQKMASKNHHVKQAALFHDSSKETHGNTLEQENTKKINSKAHLSSSTDLIQRAIDVYLDTNDDDRKVLKAEGDVSNFSGGSSASGTQGWINVVSYRSSCYIYEDNSKADQTHYATSPNLQNIFTQPQRGHLLGKQNGGNGSDEENLFAQDGGANAGRYKDFEGEVKTDIGDADVGSWAVYTSYLEGDGANDIEIGNILGESLSDAESIESD